MQIKWIQTGHNKESQMLTHLQQNQVYQYQYQPPSLKQLTPRHLYNRNMMTQPFTTLQNTIFNNKGKLFLQYKNTQIKKLNYYISRASTTTSKTANTFSTIGTSSTTPSIQNKQVINLPKKDLTCEEKSLLQKSPKFAITPATIPFKEYILTTTVAAL